MITLKPSKNILWVWRIRLALMSLFPSVLNSWLFETMSTIWIVITVIWMVIFIFFYTIYYPLKFRKLSYTADNYCFTKNYGTLYTITKSMPLHSIQFIVKRTSPLEKAVGLCGFRLIGAGSQISILGLKPDELDFLYEFMGAKKDE